MDDRYIAGFFDGEGSAMIVTIKKRAKHGIIYQFRPVIKISQKTTEILVEIKNHLNFGHVDHGKTPSFIVCGNKEIGKFIERISPYTFIKTKALQKLNELIKIQEIRINKPYTKEVIEKMISLRNDIKKLNGVTRSNISMKYSRETILSTMSFPDIDKWNKERLKTVQELAYKVTRKPRKTISCTCGCGKTLITPDKRGADRKYIQGHNNRSKTWMWSKCH